MADNTIVDKSIGSLKNFDLNSFPFFNNESETTQSAISSGAIDEKSNDIINSTIATIESEKSLDGNDDEKCSNKKRISVSPKVIQISQAAFPMAKNPGQAIGAFVFANADVPIQRIPDDVAPLVVAYKKISNDGKLEKQIDKLSKSLELLAKQNREIMMQNNELLLITAYLLNDRLGFRMDNVSSVSQIDFINNDELLNKLHTDTKNWVNRQRISNGRPLK